MQRCRLASTPSCEGLSVLSAKAFAGVSPVTCSVKLAVAGFPHLHYTETHRPTCSEYSRPSCRGSGGLQAFSDVFPHLVTATNVPRLVKIADVDWSGVDAAFCCLPHATTQEILASLPREVRASCCTF